jgi:Domain of unknown function (DUF4430)
VECAGKFLIFDRGQPWIAAAPAIRSMGIRRVRNSARSQVCTLPPSRANESSSKDSDPNNRCAGAAFGYVDALEEAFRIINDTKAFTYALQYFGSALGYLVLMINEAYDSFISSSSPFSYWEILVNGVSATQGINHILLQSGDHLMFSFERYDPLKHKNSTLRLKYEHQMKAQKEK